MLGLAKSYSDTEEIMHANFGSLQLSTKQGPSWAQAGPSLQKAIDKQHPNWYENFVFMNDARTQGRSPSSSKLQALGLPQSLQGFSVLDIGAYEGFYSVAMEQRGAEVIANDFFVWAMKDDPSLDHFNFIREATGSSFSTLTCDISELPQDSADIALFLGVLYHLEDQLAALRKVRRSARKLVVLETLVDVLDQPGPAMRYYPGAALNDDVTNNFGPNLHALAALVESAGFSRWEFKGMWEVNTVGSLAKSPSLSPISSGRVVLWCWV